MTREQRSEALITTGEIIGLLLKLDIEALEDVIKNPQPDFQFMEQCGEILQLAKSLKEKPI